MTDTKLIPRLIKTAKKVFRYDKTVTTWGWSHDVYYDRVSNVFLIENFPAPGHYFEVGVPMDNGTAEIEVDNTKYKIRISEQ